MMIDMVEQIHEYVRSGVNDALRRHIDKMGITLEEAVERYNIRYRNRVEITEDNHVVYMTEYELVPKEETNYD